MIAKGSFSIKGKRKSRQIKEEVTELQLWLASGQKGDFTQLTWLTKRAHGEDKEAGHRLCLYSLGDIEVTEWRRAWALPRP